MGKLDVGEWLKSGRYLPSPLRDFHDQKNVFKAMHGTVREQQFVRRPDWVEGQVYVIDVFLWFMATHGWTLQRTRHGGDFVPLSDTIAAWRAQEAAGLAEALRSRQADSAVTR